MRAAANTPQTDKWQKARRSRKPCHRSAQLQRQPIGQHGADHPGHNMQRAYRGERLKTQPNQRHHRPSLERLTITQRLQPFSRFDQPPDPAQLRAFILERRATPSSAQRRVNRGAATRRPARCHFGTCSRRRFIEWPAASSLAHHRFVITIRKWSPIERSNGQPAVRRSIRHNHS